VIGKAASMLTRISPKGDVVFAGGVALNQCATELFATETGRVVLTPPDPQILGAIGAAIYAAKRAGKPAPTGRTEEGVF
jgi:activator of 2-hydroxyglutaryl-CoA dehydratase